MTNTTATAAAPDLLSPPRILLPRDMSFDRETRQLLDLISERSADSTHQHDHDKSNTEKNDESAAQSQQQQQEQGRTQTVAAACHALSSSGNADRVTLTMNGYKEGYYEGNRQENQINQDRALIVNPLLGSSSSSLVQKEQHGDNDDSDVVVVVVSPSMLMGVLDGHGKPGHHVSEFVRIQLEQRLTAALQQDLLAAAATTATAAADTDQQTQPRPHTSNSTAAAADANSNKSSLSSSLLLLNNTTYVSNLLTNLVEQIDRDLPAPDGIDGGSTVSLVLQLGQHVYLINAGDSQSFIAATTTTVNTANGSDATTASTTTTTTTMKTTTVILQKTLADKPGRPDERARIEAAGGELQPQDPGDDANNARLRFYDQIVYGYNSLPMSRCLGDHCGVIGLIATPTIQVFTIPELLAQATDMLFRDKKLMLQTTPTSSTTNSNENPELSLQEQPLQQERTCVDTSDSSASPNAKRVKTDSNPDIHLFAVSATDGLGDFVPLPEIADKMGHALFLAARTTTTTPTSTTTTATSSRLPSPAAAAAALTFTAAEQVLLLAANGWQKKWNGRYRDDIAIAVATLHPTPPPTSS